MDYQIDYIPKSTPHRRRPGIPMKPEYITIHSTGNLESTARNERGWLVNPKNSRQASWHICVDENGAIEAIPLSEVAWHAGDGAGPGNMKSISIEICESGDRAKTLENAAALTARLLREKGWGVERLKRHYDWSGKICPRIFYDEGTWAGWEQFKLAVQKILKEGGAMTADKNQPSPWAKEAWEWARREGLLDGTRPKDNITREELALVLKRLVGKR